MSAAVIHLRRADPDDVPLVLAFIRELAEYERLLDKVIATEEALRAALFGPSPAAEVQLAFLDTEAVGFALFFPVFSTFAARRGLYLEDLFVRPHARGKGVGRRLLVELAHLARERDWARVQWQVLDWNEPALRFYRSLGARAMEEWTEYRLMGEALERLAAERPGVSA